MKKRKLLWIILSFVIVLLLAACYFAYPYLQQLWEPIDHLSLAINGPQFITLEYGSEYHESGAKAVYTVETKDVDSVLVPVKITGEVDTNKLGEYLITYSVERGEKNRTASRRVRVVDTRAPVITLDIIPGSYTLPNHPYEEEGFTAIDNYDGDLTEQVICTEVDGQVIYTVSDSSGNTTTVSRTIRYFDPTPPELQLNGERIIVLNTGNQYNEPGFTASDDCDGDLTAAVTVSGELNTDRAGTYTLTYSVTNAYGDTTTLERTVYVVDPYTPSGGSGSSGAGKVIYLTFDDGPSNYTSRLLDILAKYNVKATFFVVNTGAISIISRAAAEGHTVAVHTTTHNFDTIYASEEAYIKDLETMQDIIYQYTGTKTMMFRFPGGSSNTVSRFNKGIMTRLTKLLPEMGYRYFDWNVDSNDAGGATTSAEVFNNVIRGIQQCKSAIVLQHDTQGFSVSAVEKIIVWGLSNGYTFLPLTYNSPGSHHGVNN